VPGSAVITARTGAGAGPGEVEVEVEWNAVPGATGYRVLRKIGDAVAVQQLTHDLVVGTAVSDWRQVRQDADDK